MTTFWVMADTGYTATAKVKLKTFCENVPASARFVAHVGDLWASTLVKPSVTDYRTVAETLRLCNKPVFITIGDNEYNDTRTPAASLNNWRSVLGYFDQNWDHAIDVYRQPGRSENWAFTLEGLCCIGLHLTGGRKHDALEWAERTEDAAAWLSHAIDPTAHSAVIVAHTSPEYNSVYENSFLPTLVSVAGEFAKPILYLQGDAHEWGRKKAYKAANITKIKVGQTGAGSTKPLLVTATGDPANPWVLDHKF